MTKHPTLYYKARTGRTHQWTVWSEGPTVFTEFGQVGGKLQVTPGKTCGTMNAGQSNERTPDQQAESVAGSMWQNKIDRKYALTPEAALESKEGLPMLAHRYDERGHKVLWPALAQPKLNGLRAQARWVDGKVQLVSRSGVESYSVQHLQEALELVLPKGDEFDGELYMHGRPLQEINSLVKKPKPESKFLQYWIYDMPVVNGQDGLPFAERLQGYGTALEQRSARWGANLLVPVDTYRINDEQAALTLLEEFLKNGYEGLMVRNLMGLYAWGDRSVDLQKIKRFIDAEFPIQEVEEGVGRMAGSAILVCLTPEGKPFRASIAATQEERRAHWGNRQELIGRLATVKYQELSKDGIPIFPVCTQIRLKEDM